MTPRPILFSAPMIRALIEGRKTQTRRAVKLPEKKGNRLGVWEATTVGGNGCYFRDGSPAPEEAAIWHTRTGYCFTCPYGKPGDLLWVRETWAHTGTGVWKPSDVYLARDGEVVYRADDGDEDGCSWFPSIFMLRQCSRLTLEITDVRIERLQDISEGDAIAEGINFDASMPSNVHRHWLDLGNDSKGAEWLTGWDARDVYRQLWHVINGPGAWEQNPWVWALTFKVHKANVDAVTRQIANTPEAA